MKTPTILALVLILILTPADYAQKKPSSSSKTKKTAVKKGTTNKKSRYNYYKSGTRKKKSRSSRRTYRTSEPISPREDVTTMVAPGVTYMFHQEKTLRCDVHTLIADLNNQELAIDMGKGLEHISGLERVYDIARRMDSIGRGARKVLGGTNANFWKAGTIHPMGLTVIDGVTLVNQKYLNWPSIVVTESGRLSIDEYTMSTEIRTRYGSIPINKFNHRNDSLSVVVYTKYFGSSVPFVDIEKIREASSDTITDESETEQFFSTTVDSLVSSHPEIGTLKLQFQYLQPPKANTITPCRITTIDTGLVVIPPNGGVLSFGRGKFPLFFSVFVGDTFTIASRLFPEVPEPVEHIACGTPILVKNGHNYIQSNPGDVGRLRFVNARHARSAIGISHDGTKVIFMTVEAASRSARRYGMALSDLARLMIERGAWSAMNFDGGGSATMVVDGETVAPPNANNRSRKISTAMFVTRKLKR